MLPGLPAATLTAEGVRRAINGCQLGPSDLQKGLGIGDWGLDGPGGPAQSLIPNPQSLFSNPESRLFRLLDPSGALVGIARPSRSPGLLHPAVVLM